MNNFFNKKSILVIALTLICSGVFSQYEGIPLQGVYGERQKVSPYGLVEKIESSYLNETRILNIYLPRSYHPDSAQTFPVIYVFDFDSLNQFESTVSMVLSASQNFSIFDTAMKEMRYFKMTPESIVVGIECRQPYTDFTWLSSDSLEQIRHPDAGGVDSFLAFISKELIPHIHTKYQCSTERTLISHDYAALLGFKMLFSHTDLFSEHVIIHPRLNWDNGSTVTKTERFIAQLKDSVKSKLLISYDPESYPNWLHEISSLINKSSLLKSQEFAIYLEWIRAEGGGQEDIFEEAIGTIYYERFQKNRPSWTLPPEYRNK